MVSVKCLDFRSIPAFSHSRTELDLAMSSRYNDAKLYYLFHTLPPEPVSRIIPTTQNRISTVYKYHIQIGKQTNFLQIIHFRDLYC